MKNKYLTFLIILFSLLLFLKIDFRYQTDWLCCSDEFDYYSHIKTVADDLDFDYENQFGVYKEARNTINGKPAPLGFFGTSLLSIPFYVVGKFFNSFVSDNQTNLNNFEIVFTSLSSIFYLFLSLILLLKTKNLLNKTLNNNIILYSLLGSGITYYAFERYLMPHVFEVFSISLIIFYLVKLYSSNEKKYMIIIPYLFLLAFLVRWTNYHILFLPIIVKTLFFKNSNLKIFNLNFAIHSLISTAIFFFLSKAIYGVYTINPLSIYSLNSNKVSSFFDDLRSDFFGSIIEILRSLFLINFGTEFGIFWFSPVLIIGFYFAIKLVFKNFRTSIFVILTYLYQFGIVVMWRSAGSSYGFRYLLSLIPISILLIVYFGLSKYMRYYFFGMSSFAILSTLMFETTNLTQLSLDMVENSFNNTVRYAQPEYLNGVFSSLINIEAWMIILSTSILFSMFLKISFFIIGKNTLLNFLTSAGLPADNDDFQNLLINVENTNTLIYLIYILFFTVLILYYQSEKLDTSESKY